MRVRTNRFAVLAASVFIAVGCSAPTAPTVDPATDATSDDDYLRPSATPVSPHLTHPKGELAGTIPLGGRPFGLAVTPSGTAIASQLDRASVTMIPLTGAAPLTVPVGHTPTGVAAIGDRWALVTNQASGDVSIVNVVTRRETSIVRVPHAPFRVLADPAGEMAYATINHGLVMFIDLANREVTRTVAVAHAPNGLAIHGERLYVSSMTGGIAVIDRRRGMVERTIAIPQMLQDLAIDRAGRNMYVASESDPYIRVVSLATGTVVDSLYTATAGGGSMYPNYPYSSGTFGLALSPDESQIYATSRGNLLVLDVATRSLVRTLALGGVLRRVAFNASGTTAVVTNEAGMVHIIE